MALLYPLVYGILRLCLRVNNDCGLDREAMGEGEVDGGEGERGGTLELVYTWRRLRYESISCLSYSSISPS